MAVKDEDKGLAADDEKFLKSSKAGGAVEDVLVLLSAPTKSVKEGILCSGTLDAGSALSVVAGTGTGSKSSKRLTEVFVGFADDRGIEDFPEEVIFNEANASKVAVALPFEGFVGLMFKSRVPNGSNDGGLVAGAGAAAVFELDIGTLPNFPTAIEEPEPGAC